LKDKIVWTIYRCISISFTTDDGQHVGRNAFCLWPIKVFKSSWFLHFSIQTTRYEEHPVWNHYSLISTSRKSVVDKFHTTWDANLWSWRELNLMRWTTMHFTAAVSLQFELKYRMYKNLFNQNKYGNIFTVNEVRCVQNTSTQSRPPNSRLSPNADSARAHHRRHHSLVCISRYQSRHCQNLILISLASYKRRTRRVKRDGYWLLYLE
jgi:hypothetical protein